MNLLHPRMRIPRSSRERRVSSSFANNDTEITQCERSLLPFTGKRFP